MAKGEKKIREAMDLLDAAGASYVIYPKAEVDLALKINEIFADKATERAVARSLRANRWLHEQIVIAMVDAAKEFQDRREAR
jgi:hypothetical protein